MAHALQEFLNAANSNTIRANNQYEVECTSGISEIDEVLQKAVMFGSNFSLPNRTIEYASVSYKGYEMTNLVPTRMTMEQEHTMTIKCDVNGEYRRAFLAWMNSVIDADIAGGSVFAGDRGVNENSIVRVRLFDKDNQTVIETYKFYNVRIKSVGNVALTYDGGEVATFEVQFTSTYWQIEKAEKGKLTNQK